MKCKNENENENENENNVGIIKTHEGLFDSITIATSIDICNIIYDNNMSYEIYEYQADMLILKQEILNQSKKILNVHAKIQKNEKNEKNVKMPPRVIHSYLRSFTTTSHLYNLNTFINTIYLKSSLYSSFNDDNEHGRTCDEVVQAYLRCGGVPYALEVASMKEFRDFSETVLNNILIYYDR
jgi:hypothetical protein